MRQAYIWSWRWDAWIGSQTIWGNGWDTWIKPTVETNILAFIGIVPFLINIEYAISKYTSHNSYKYIWYNNIYKYYKHFKYIIIIRVAKKEPQASSITLFYKAEKRTL